ncbi:cytochrome c3 family protein [Fontivita pretiosa]|uniref:cytochrome c3 family protein n=1 Tax=Fontivita pretiosa TaxID=2989684 RepID=UPI003D16A447
MKQPAAAILIVWSLLSLEVCVGATTRPSGVIEPKDCVSSQCHANIKASKLLHGPVAADACDACHQLVDPATHKFGLWREQAELCTYCHEFDVADMPVVHKPVRGGQCLGCHDPHGSARRSMTREDSMQALCYRCHERIAEDRKFLHRPVSLGQCDSCHPPHAARFPKLLDAVSTDLCLACHSDFETDLSRVRFGHKALEQGCEKCHDPHGSDFPAQTLQPSPQLCQQCHEKVRNQIERATVKHSVVSKDRACLTCHTPHGADVPRLMVDQPIVVCMNCHKQDIRIDRKTVIPAVRELTDPGMHRHGAIKDGQCSGCHAAHGSDQPALLTRVYRTTFYQPFSVANYELCFACHDQRLVQQENAGTITGFRNGDRNLHWVHVKEGQRGRACAVCHTTHASPNERNIRQTTPLKIWNMPLRFRKTETGGSCAPGCHGPWGYDRVNPLPSPTSRPATQPAPRAIARAAAEGPAIVSLKATSLDGSTVQVPDSSGPTVLLFVGSDVAEHRRLVAAVERALTDEPHRAQVVLIVCGPDAQAAANQLAQATPRHWPIIADSAAKICGELQIHGWPMGLVLQSDGTEIARIGGAPESFVLKLRPYLDLASGRIDATALAKQLASTRTVGSTRSRASRELRLAEQLLDAGRAAEALPLLTESLKSDPDSVPLRVMLIRALARAGRGADAIAQLSRLPADALPPGQAELLRAEAYIAMDRWADAKAAATRASELAPDSPQAHLLLGRIYENERDWQNAAIHYRAAAIKANR